MSASQLLATLTASGVTVEAVDDRLRIDAPQGTLTPELRSALVEQKPALLELLRIPGRPRPLHLLCAGCKGFFMHEPATLCYWCRQKKNGKALGPPCPGCGEACEQCLGEPSAGVQDGY